MSGRRRWIPAALRVDDDQHLTWGRVERSRKDWVLDALAVIAAVGFGILLHIDGLHSDPSDLLVVIDIAALPIAAVLLFFRRRWPLAVALALAVISALAPSVSIAALIVAFAVASWARPPLGLIGIAAILAAVPFDLLLWPNMAEDTSFLSDLVFRGLIVIIAGAWGLFAGARRQLVASLQERATRAESDQALRLDQARAQERTRIAHEMHDVLAHRMSLLSIHAGALEFRPDAPPADIARAAGVIRATAHEALEELRAVIGVMRVGDALATEGPGSAADTGAQSPRPEAPQPTLSSVPELVDGWQAAGARITLDLDQAGVAQLPPTIGRAAYRIVQEALTNAGKHAPTAKVSVQVSGTPGDLLVVSVINPLGVGLSATQIPGTGLGLVGLRERTELAGGAFAAGVDEDLQRFVLEARLPWPQA